MRDVTPHIASVVRAEGLEAREKLLLVAMLALDACGESPTRTKIEDMLEIGHSTVWRIMGSLAQKGIVKVTDVGFHIETPEFWYETGRRDWQMFQGGTSLSQHGTPNETPMSQNGTPMSQNGTNAKNKTSVSSGVYISGSGVASGVVIDDSNIIHSTTTTTKEGVGGTLDAFEVDCPVQLSPIEAAVRAFCSSLRQDGIEAFYKDINSPTAICCALVGGFSREKRWRQCAKAIPDLELREELAAFYSEVKAGERPRSIGAALNARLTKMNPEMLTKGVRRRK